MVSKPTGPGGVRHLTLNVTAGDLIGNRYRLINTLGAGGFGRVWRAHDETLRSDVAAKEVTSRRGPIETEQLARAAHEARNAAKIRDHANIVTIYDMITVNGKPWIIMQLVDGRSLAEELKTDGPLTLTRTLRMAKELLSALVAVHNSSVSHRDIKPHNVMLAKDGTTLLADFGIAFHRDDTRITPTGAVIGTPAYMAPERLQGMDRGAASDMFSLGVTLYEALEGKRPFVHDVLSSTMQLPPNNAAHWNR